MECRQDIRELCRGEIKVTLLQPNETSLIQPLDQVLEGMKIN